MDPVKWTPVKWTPSNGPRQMDPVNGPRQMDPRQISPRQMDPVNGPRQMDPVKWTPSMDPVKWTPSSSRQRTESKPHIARHGHEARRDMKHAGTWSTQGHEARRDVHSTKLQALVYDILPLTTVVFSYAIGSRKLSANEQFFFFFFFFFWCVVKQL